MVLLCTCLMISFILAVGLVKRADGRGGDCSRNTREEGSAVSDV